MSALPPFCPRRGKDPLPSLCNACVVLFYEEQRKDCRSPVPICSHQPETEDEREAMAATFWANILYSYKSS